MPCRQSRCSAQTKRNRRCKLCVGPKGQFLESGRSHCWRHVNEEEEEEEEEQERRDNKQGLPQQFSLYGASRASYWRHSRNIQSVLLLGEDHTHRANRSCAPSTQPTYNLTEFVPRLLSNYQRYFFDVFFEANPPEILEQHKKFYAAASSPLTDTLNAFKDCIYGDAKGRRICPSQNVRMHWIDWRHFELLRPAFDLDQLYRLANDLYFSPQPTASQFKKFRDMVFQTAVSLSNVADSKTAQKRYAIREFPSIEKEIKRVDARFGNRKKLQAHLTQLEEKDLAAYEKKIPMLQKLLKKIVKASKTVDDRQMVESIWNLEKKGKQLSSAHFEILKSSIHIMDAYGLARLWHRFQESEERNNAHPNHVQNAIFITGRGHTRAYETSLREMGYENIWEADAQDTFCTHLSKELLEQALV